jgi:ribosomal protein L37AE/L43A
MAGCNIAGRTKKWKPIEDLAYDERQADQGQHLIKHLNFGMWTCPRCGREFRNSNQSHTCRLIDKEQLFAKRPAELKNIYIKIVSIVKTVGEFREETVPPDMIFFKTVSTFLGVKVKRDHLEIEFFLDHLDNAPAVSKHLQTSSRRFVHLVPVDSVEEIDTQLINWIKDPYQLVLSKKNKK